MSGPVDPRSPDVEELRRAEAAAPGPSAQVQDEVFARLRHTLALPLAPGGDEGGGGGRGASDGGAAATDPIGPSAAPSSGPRATGAEVARIVAPRAGRQVVRTIATLALGATLGAGVHEAFDRRAGRRAPLSPATDGPRFTQPAMTSPPPSSEAPGSDVRIPSAAAPNIPSMGPAVPLRRSSTVAGAGSRGAIAHPLAGVADAAGPPRDRDRDLASERSLVERARTALSRGQAAAALATLERHARDFPHGTLSEERESLEVQALVALQRYERARRVGADFHRRFPSSIFGAVVDEVLGSIP